MTTYAKEQAAKLLDTGGCDLPLTYEDVANHVKANPLFAPALRNLAQGNGRLMEMITITAAHVLCKDFDLTEVEE